MTAKFELIELDGHEVKVTNPGKVFFPEIGVTKLDLVQYYLSVAPGAIRGVFDRPTSLKRFPDGAGGEFFFQKRVPTPRPDWIQTAMVRFPSGRSAEFLTIVDRAHMVWAINLGCIDLNPWPVRRTDLDRPDELRVDIDPTPGISFEQVREVAMSVKEVLDEHGLAGFPKTSGSRGIHINVRIEARWGFTEVRRAALSLAREVERRDPRATTAWWKETRHGVFLDYNQNARDRTVASAYSPRPVPGGRVSTPLEWDEVLSVEPGDWTILTVPDRFAERGDPHGPIDETAGSLESLLELSLDDERQGLGDAPWPPNFPKMPGEPKRVQPSKARPADGPKGLRGK
ncbi:MAG: DNA polymerase domain-containing protein [Actinomycetota bacterium]